MEHKHDADFFNIAAVITMPELLAGGVGGGDETIEGIINVGDDARRGPTHPSGDTTHR
jgi:hypothetical protein